MIEYDEELMQRKIVESAKQKNKSLTNFEKKSILNVLEVIVESPEGMPFHEVVKKVDFHKNKFNRIVTVAKILGFVEIEIREQAVGKKGSSQIIRLTDEGLINILPKNASVEKSQIEEKDREKIEVKENDSQPSVSKAQVLLEKEEVKGPLSPFNVIVSKAQIEISNELLDKHKNGLPMKDIFYAIKLPYNQKSIQRLLIYLEENKIKVEVTGNYPDFTIKKIMQKTTNGF